MSSLQIQELTEIDRVSDGARQLIDLSRERLWPDLRANAEKVNQLNEQRAARITEATTEMVKALEVVAEQYNKIIATYSETFKNVVAKISGALPSETSMQVHDSVLIRDQSMYPKAFVVHSSIRKVAPFEGQTSNQDRVLNYAQSEPLRMREEFKNMRLLILTPAVSQGFTRNVEKHSRGEKENRIIEDRRREVFEDPGQQLLKSLFIDQAGTFSVLTYAQATSREHQHVEVNPHACYSSGFVDYDEVRYEHFFRWQLSLDLASAAERAKRVGQFEIQDLTPLEDFVI